MQFNFRQNQHNKQGKVNTIQSSVLLLLLQCTVIALLEVSNIYIYSLYYNNENLKNTWYLTNILYMNIDQLYMYWYNGVKCTWILINCTSTGIMVLNVHGY